MAEYMNNQPLLSRCRLRYLLLVIVVLGNSGCAIYPEQGQKRTTDRHVYHPARQQPDRPASTNSHREPEQARPVTSQPRASSNSGVATLLQQASQARMAGDLDRAQSLAERAQTLAPRQGHSYLELARIYQAKGDHSRARQMALRGMAYAGDDLSLKQSLQALSAP